MKQINLLVIPEDIQLCEKTRYNSGTIKPSEMGKNFKPTTEDIRKNAGKTDDASLMKYDINKDGVIDDNDVVASYSNKNTVKVTAPSDVAAIENKKDSDVITTNSEGVVALNSASNTENVFKTITVIDADVNKTIQLKSTESITLDGITVSGGKDNLNGKITYATPKLELKNIKAEDGTTIYNAFEGYLKTNDPDYTGLEELNAENLEFLAPSLTHNVINVYTPASNAVINIKNSKFDLNVANTNVLRMSNYMNSENVTINFENVEWTYENVETAENDWKWAGLMIFQPASSDIALTGDTSKIATWTINIKNCKYNGEKVTANNFGEHNQVVYLYNVGNTGAVSDASKVMKINFK